MRTLEIIGLNVSLWANTVLLTPFVAIRCNRYDKIEQYLHPSDKNVDKEKGDPEYDKLGKVREVIETLSRTFKQYHKIGKNVSIDEAIITFSGVLGFLQYIPSKPIKRGIKLWARACATSAYMDRFNIYLRRADKGYPKGLGHHVVSNMTDNIRNSHRHVYMDNFFSSCH